MTLFNTPQDQQTERRNIPRDGTAQGMDPEEDKACPRSSTMQHIELQLSVSNIHAHTACERRSDLLVPDTSEPCQRDVNQPSTLKLTNALTRNDVVLSSEGDNERELARCEMRSSVLKEPVLEVFRYEQVSDQHCPGEVM